MSDPEKPKLKPANEDPWYVLMTVAGEQNVDHFWDYDLARHALNRRFWNGWVAQALSDEEKNALVATDRANNYELAPFSSKERATINRQLEDRSIDPETLDPSGSFELSFIKFGDIYCEGFLFPKRTSFQGSEFSGHADFRGATFFDYADFRGTTFSQYAYFSKVTFKSPTSFAPVPGTHRKLPTRFESAPPAFFNANLYEDFDITDVVWPGVPGDRDSASRYRIAYEQLKLVMDGRKRTYDEHLLFRKEMECREVETKDRLTRLCIWAFRELSDFGWSLKQPLKGLGFTLVLGWAAIGLREWWDYNLGDWPAGTEPEYLGFWQSGFLSLSNVFGFLGFNRTFLAEEVKTLTAFSEIVSGTQTVAGLVLFFLLGLALRNRFRLK